MIEKRNLMGGICLFMALLAAGCGNPDEKPEISQSDSASQNMVSENVSVDIVSENQTAVTYESRPISYNVEDYIFLSMEETYAWLAPYGFCISRDHDDDEDWLCRYTGDGEEDRTE